MSKPYCASKCILYSDCECTTCCDKAYQQGRADAIHRLKFIIELLEGNDSTLDIIKEVLADEDKKTNGTL